MNRHYQYSKNSSKEIDSTMPITQKLCHFAIKIANERMAHCPDFGISSGTRSTEEQFNLFKVGRTFESKHMKDYIVTGNVVTNSDGIHDKSSHQTGLAIDFYAYVDGKANYDIENLALIATCFFEAAAMLGIKVLWGGNFRSFIDGAHIEIVQ